MAPTASRRPTASRSSQVGEEGLRDMRIIEAIYRIGFGARVHQFGKL
jgi:hypothetical protein